MLHLTPAAAELLLAIRARKGHADGALVRVTGEGGGVQRGVRLGFVDEPEDGDVVAEAHGLPYCVCPRTAGQLGEVTMDVREHDGRRRFVLGHDSERLRP